jgi:hypothetical protein
MNWQISERAVQDQDLAFLEAFAETETPIRPSIRTSNVMHRMGWTHP